jgi:DNA (cytosine-5)-methyltransferase 1
VRECARLQGFPDDHTLIPGYGGAVFHDDADLAAMAKYLGFASTDALLAFDPPADGPQYKAYGNSMARKVLRWLLTRIVRVDRGEAPECPA